ncbi:MAG: methyltransferase domain-containing protein [Acidobacteria bacterium]|nr:methyltransferase domain-containing protein [Acidobacteriota bacterium]
MNHVNLGNLCVWGGVQDRPGVRRRLPFVWVERDGLVRLDLSKDAQQSIVEHYASADYSFITSPPGASGWGTALGDAQFDYIRRFVPGIAGAHVLELGSGSLYLGRRVIHELNAERFIAVDPVLKGQLPEAGIDVVADYFEPQRFAGQRIDMVLSINTLEHVPDPVDYMAGVHTLLAERGGGTFFVMVPECSNGFRNGDWGICLHEHLSFFTVASFRAAAAAAGFVVQDLLVEDDEIIATLTVDRPHSIGGHHPRLQDIERRFQATKSAAEALFDRLLKSGEGPIGIHGCSVAVNELISAFGLENADNIVLFDRDEAKHGKYLPAFHRPILDCADTRYSEMSAIVVGVTTYFDKIKAYGVGRGIRHDRVFPLIPTTEADG